MQHEHPLVSVITPAYNAQDFVGEAIESVQRQTYQNWEHIIIDDGSTDDTARVIQGYAEKDSRIRYFYQKNQRMASARNNGITRARGSYIAFLDADNIFLPSKLEHQVSFLESRKDCAVCYSRILHFYDGNQEVFYRAVKEEVMHKEDMFRVFLHKNPINVLSVFIRKEAFDLHGAFPQGWWACDEQYVWINFSYHRVKFCFFDEAVGLLRVHRKEDSRRNDYLIRTAERYQDMLAIVESWFTSEERQKYQSDIDMLRKKWRIRKWVGVLLAYPPTSWVLGPLFRWRRNRLYKRIGS